MAALKSLLFVAVLVCAVEQVVESRKCVYKDHGYYKLCKKFCCGNVDNVHCRDKDDCNGIPCDKDEDCGSGCCVKGKCEKCGLSKIVLALIIVGVIIFFASVTFVIFCCRCRQKKTIVGRWNDLANVNDIET